MRFFATLSTGLTKGCHKTQPHMNEVTQGASRRPAIEVGGYTLPSPTRGLPKAPILPVETLSTQPVPQGLCKA